MASRISLRVLGTGAFLFLDALLLTSPALAAESAAEVSLRRTVEALSAPASRMTGYPGATAAREWLVAELESLGIAEIYRHEFPVLVPIDEGFWLECAGEQLELFGVWPNLVRTPTLPAEGIEGPLVYGGDGSRLEGQPVAGRIVLLDYVSGTAWVDAFHLGAAAVVFLESAGTHRKEAEQKFLDVPADLPRLYARKDVAERLRVLEKSRAQVRLRGRMAWREVTAQNLVAVIPGQDATLREEVVFLAAHYDAVSPVPALAPGAEQAASAAALLELARGFAARPPKRTVALLWTAGHFQNMAGMRHFAPLLLAAAGQREGEVEGTALLRRLSALETRFFSRLGSVVAQPAARGVQAASSVSRLIARAADHRSVAKAGNGVRGFRVGGQAGAGQWPEAGLCPPRLGGDGVDGAVGCGGSGPRRMSGVGLLHGQRQPRPL